MTRRGAATKNGAIMEEDSMLGLRMCTRCIAKLGELCSWFSCCERIGRGTFIPFRWTRVQQALVAYTTNRADIFDIARRRNPGCVTAASRETTASSQLFDLDTPEISTTNQFCSPPHVFLLNSFYSWCRYPDFSARCTRVSHG